MSVTESAAGGEGVAGADGASAATRASAAVSASAAESTSTYTGWSAMPSDRELSSISDDHPVGGTTSSVATVSTDAAVGDPVPEPPLRQPEPDVWVDSDPYSSGRHRDS
ncbi:MAG: hypothetical protein IRZ07_06870 [Microbispora sp.]|nr:hypothetical protein [Microbispora sp.]